MIRPGACAPNSWVPCAGLFGFRARDAQVLRAALSSSVRRTVAPAHGTRGSYFLLLAPSSLDSTAMKASCGTSTLPTIFIRFLPSFCFSSSFRLREMSPP